MPTLLRFDGKHHRLLVHPLGRRLILLSVIVVVLGHEETTSLWAHVTTIGCIKWSRLRDMGVSPLMHYTNSSCCSLHAESCVT